jgi:hypothetical protein
MRPRTTREMTRVALIASLFLLTACEEPTAGTASSASAPAKSSSAAPKASASAATAPASASASAPAEEKKQLGKLPGKLEKGLGKSTPEDIKKACEANGLKCELKKWDDDEGKKFPKYSISFGDNGLWVNIWTLVGAPEERTKVTPGGRPGAADGKMFISIDASDKGARDDEGKRVLDALMGTS